MAASEIENLSWCNQSKFLLHVSLQNRYSPEENLDGFHSLPGYNKRWQKETDRNSGTRPTMATFVNSENPMSYSNAAEILGRCGLRRKAAERGSSETLKSSQS